jgi:hypothetical protein
MPSVQKVLCVSTGISQRATATRVLQPTDRDPYLCPVVFLRLLFEMALQTIDGMNLKWNIRNGCQDSIDF